MTTDFSPRKIFVTAALPYANGAYHIGHIMEYIQADIWVRYQRMCGHSVDFVCADDVHGAPIMIAAQKSGLTPQQFVARVSEERKPYLDGFHIAFDNWYSTDAPENYQMAQDIYRDLQNAGFIAARMVEQFYDSEKGIFLADRFIKGECPRCGSKDQYGDNCEVCGAVYAPTDLKNPYSILSGTKPQLRSSEHIFFTLSDPRCVEFLKNWTQDGKFQTDISNKVREWFRQDEQGRVELKDWDISRDAPYFGIEIPDAPGKYFYVWMDAPVGYLSTLKNLLNRRGVNFDAYMDQPELEQYHFIGKDILTFHVLFWPAMLYFSHRKIPTNIFVHGHLTINGEKMSKSRGTGLDPVKYLTLGMDPQWLRYYFAAKLSGRNEDIDFNAEDFQVRVNSDLIGKYINIASRVAGFINKRFNGRLTELDADGLDLLAMLRRSRHNIHALFAARDTSKVVRDVMLLSDYVNEYVDRNKPWEIAKQFDHAVRLQQVCTTCIEAFRVLTIYLKPVLPALAANVELFLQCQPLDFSVLKQPLGAGHTIGAFKHLMQRVDTQQLEALFTAQAENCALPSSVVA
ncbi:methionine--tRNA ligase [Verminephrobacter aporrectodeae subsp. tuberculatae]|uniref:Methionine--tRNA ligase n=1 Tax=Verminephrobacter aporrectodeae subsp. tuberculatae TaxID=1110392 RepID=A0ABT3KXY5_9BURK|nr:methionine--tRNA ligase [Verminephrobacter aporrectodeae subsp. tuberculatae]MCW5323203.1 methionine--tRNA ligase [Verminephrobacter aporrectodeae subsp. tuberculatae]MCW8177268.1 methionine--tRNA ligase [Verminephrobacter aporrectodeae subsp. tuberculatae]MCW8200341.1 methionine--tRNA ligase [Verminephrobacter aporrectodeae subsp. tuberculatae]MCW8204698.1 methionine--tRNA ligase [Verminephrobacter aporrectodeae subsp. tuberculatae]